MELEQTVIEIPNGPEVNYLIGSKGAGINALQDATGTRIQIQRTHEVPPGALVRTVTIWGGEAHRQHCAQLIQQKVVECQQRDQVVARPPPPLHPLPPSMGGRFLALHQPRWPPAHEPTHRFTASRAGRGRVRSPPSPPPPPSPFRRPHLTSPALPPRPLRRASTAARPVRPALLGPRACRGRSRTRR